MTGGLRPYPAMKDSGVAWLGEVPEHWEVRPIAGLGSLFKGNGGNKGDEVSDGVPCVRYGDLYTRHEFFITKSKTCVSNERAGAYTSIRYGDVLFAASGETMEDIGRSAVNLILGEARCGGDVLVLRPGIPAVPRYLGYAADSPASRNQKACMGRGFTVVHIYGSQLKRLLLPLPPVSEQAAIVRFLDHADRRLRRYIRAKQKLIKLLDEQKQAIIHRAVTRGLDPNVRLKPSGVEWLGDVPEHWEVVALKRACLLLRDGTHLPPPRTSLGVPLLSVRNIVAERFTRRDDDSMISEADYRQLCRSFVPLEDDVLLAIVGATLGKVAIVPKMDRFHIQRSLAIFRPRPERLSCHFLAAYLRAPSFQRALWTTVAFSAQPGIYLNTLANFRVVLPPLAEQTRIVEALAAAISEVDAPIRTANHEVSLLREFRTRLIADVVTGKLDVREAAARLPQGAEELEPLDDTEALREMEGESAADDLEPESQEADA
jgi:type I restriction enzyme S subunit